MNLKEAVYELHGYIKAICDATQLRSEMQRSFKGEEFKSEESMVPSPTQWLRITHDVSSMVKYIEKGGVG